MSNVSQLAAAFAIGICLGTVYFGGLWYTVRRLTSTRRPGVLFFGSWVVRTVIVLTGLWLTAAGRWQSLLVCTAGLLVVRFVLVQIFGPASAPSHALSVGSGGLRNSERTSNAPQS